MGINKGTSDKAKAYFVGSVPNPEGIPFYVFICILVIAGLSAMWLIIFCCAIAFYNKKHRNKNQTFTNYISEKAGLKASDGSGGINESLDEN